MAKKKYKRLSFQERVIIQILLEEDKTKSFISERLKRARSTITREINKWVQHPGETYNADLAHWNAEDDYLNKRNRDKIGTYKSLKFYVYKGLLNQWSPEQIAGRIKLEYPNNPIMSISHEAIYMHIYSHPQARLNRKLIALLPYHKSRRRTVKGTKRRKIRIKDQVSIDQRPRHIEERLEIGHWEGDLMIGVKQSSAIGTLVERKSRLTFIVKLKNRRSTTVRKGFTKEILS